MRAPESHPMDCKKLYEEHYLNQTGRGMAAFTGARYQRGHGLGNMLHSLTKFALAFLKKGAKAVGKQAMKTGMNIAQEVMSGQSILKSSQKTSFSRLDRVGHSTWKRPTQKRTPW